VVVCLYAFLRPDDGSGVVCVLLAMAEGMATVLCGVYAPLKRVSYCACPVMAEEEEQRHQLKAERQRSVGIL
jgi:hypothetical protein